MKKVKQKKITKILLISLAMMTGLSNAQLPAAFAFTNYTEQSTKVDVSFESEKEIGKEIITINAKPKDISVTITGIQLPNGEFVNSDHATYVAEAIGDYNFTVFYKEVMEVTPPANEEEVELPNIDEEVQLPSQEEEVTEGEEQPVEDSNESTEEEQPVEDSNEPTEEEQPVQNGEAVEEVTPIMFIPQIDIAFAAEIDESNAENNATVTVEKSETFTYHVKELLENSDIDASFLSFYDEETNTEIVSIKAEVRKGDANIEGILLPNGVFVEGIEAEYEANQNGRYEFTVKYTENISENTLTQKFYYDVKQIDRSLFSVSGDFTFNPDTQTIISYSPHASKDVVIPEAINGVEVLHIGDNAFANHQLTSVVIPDTVLTIGNSAFDNNLGLTSVKMSSRVELIGDRAFSGSKQLATITLNEGLTSIGSSAFSQSGLTSITLPDSVTEIGKGAFQNCGSLTEVNLNDQITAIPDYVFSRTSITKLVVPASVKTIGESAFSHISSLKEVTFNEGLESIGEKAFESSGIEELVLPDSLTSINAYAFKEVRRLYDVTFGANLTRIGTGAFLNAGLIEVVMGDKVEVIEDYAFSGVKLIELTLSNSLTTIGSMAFQGSLLIQVDIPDSVTTIGDMAFSAWIKTINILGKDEGSIEGAPWGADSAIVNWRDTVVIGDYIVSPEKGKIIKYLGAYETVRIPSSFNHQGVNYPVTIIGNSAFSGNSWLNTVIIPDSVKVIGKDVFYNNSNLSNVTLGNGLEIIEENAFSGTSKLRIITFPDSLTTIESNAFFNSGLTTVEIHENVSSIGHDAFNTDNIKEIHIPSKLTDEIEGAPWGAKLATVYWQEIVKVDPYAFNPTTNTIVRYIGNGGDLVIPSVITVNGVNYDVLHIGKEAFLNVTNVTSVEIPDHIQTIGEGAFSKSFNTSYANDCQLKSVIIGNGVTSIPNDAFAHSEKLEEVQFGNNIEVIGERAFAGAAPLKEIHLPNKLKRIGSTAFSGVKNLTRIDIPDSVESIHHTAFSGGITEIHIPSKVTGEIEGAPWGAYRAIVYWKGVEQIGDYIFDSNTSTIVRYVGIGGSVDIPNSFYINQQEYPVSIIGKEAFKNKNLTEVNIPNNVSMIEREAFADNNLTQVTIGNGIGYIYSTAFTRNPNMTNITLDVVRDPNGSLQSGQPWGAPIDVITKYRGEFVSFNSVVELVPGEYKRNIKIRAMIENNALINEIILPDGRTLTVGNKYWPSATTYEEYIVDQPGIYTFKGKDNNSFESSYNVEVSDIGRPTVSATNATVKLDELGALTEQNLLNKVNASATTLELGDDFSGGSFSISQSDLDKVKAMTNVGEEVRIRVIATSPTGLTDSIEVVITAVIDEVNISFVDYDNKVISQSVMKIGDPLQAPTDPSRLGYDFAGWNPTVPANVPNQDAVFKATYTPRNDTQYTIEYILLDVDLNVVKVTRDTLQGVTDATITITPKDIEGYVYDPNHVDNKVSGVIDANNPTVFKLYYNQDENNNKKPDFEEIFTVSFHDYDGTLIQQNNFDNPQSVMYGKAANEPTAPTRPNYTFTGWDKTFDKVTQDLVITATYRSNSNGGGSTGTTPPVVPPVTPPTTPEVKPEGKPEVTPPGTPEVKPEVKPEIKPETKPESTLPPVTPSNPNPPVEATPEVNITVTPENSNSSANKGETTTPEKDNNKDLDAKEKDKDLMQPEFGGTHEGNCVLHWFMWLIALIMSALIVFKRNKNKKEIEAIVGRSED